VDTRIDGRLVHPAYCRACKQTTPHFHLHDDLYGVPETHWADSERYECSVCHSTIYKADRGTENADLKFILD
jgi:hypothetical protein